MAIKKDIQNVKSLITWIRTTYIPTWKTNAAALIHDLSSFSEIKDELVEFSKKTRENQKAFEEKVALVDAELSKNVSSSDDALKMSDIVKKELFATAIGIIQKQILETRDLVKVCMLKKIDAALIFERNDILYKPINNYFIYHYRLLSKKWESHHVFSQILKEGKSFVERFLKTPKLRRSISIDDKVVNITVFYERNFRMEDTEIKIQDEKTTPEQFLKKMCTDTIASKAPKTVKQRAQDILTKNTKAIMQELAQCILENAASVLQANSHLIKSSRTNVMIRLTYEPAGNAAFISRASSFQNLYFTYTVPSLFSFYLFNIQFTEKPVNINLFGTNPYHVLSHEFGHAFDLVNITFSHHIEDEARKIIGDTFTVQTYAIVELLNGIRTEGFARLQEYFTRSIEKNKPTYGAPPFITLGAGSSITRHSFTQSIQQLKEDIAMLATKKSEEVGEYVYKTLRPHWYEQGIYFCMIILIDFILRTRKQILILDTGEIKLFQDWMARKYKELGPVYYDKYLEKSSWFSAIKDAGIIPIKLNKIGKSLVKKEALHVNLPRWDIIRPFITKISLMNFIDFFKAYEQACENLGIPYKYRLSAIDEIKKAQDVSKRLNENL